MTIKTKEIAGIKFTDYMLNEFLTERCNMTVTLEDGSILRCTEVATHATPREVKHDIIIGNLVTTRHYCKHHSVQLKFSHPDIGNKLRRIKREEKNPKTKKPSLESSFDEKMFGTREVEQRKTKERKTKL